MGPKPIRQEGVKHKQLKHTQSMSTKEKFKLTNVVLYAKGWYKKTDDVWKDLQEILKLDDYVPFDKKDVFFIITRAVEEFNHPQWAKLSEVLSGIHPKNCWKVGYYINENKSWAGHNTKSHEYDMPTAFIYYVLSNLRCMDSQQWHVQMPKVNIYPKAENITINSLYEHFVKFKKITNETN